MRQWPWTRSAHNDHTDDLIAEARRTRHDLERLTGELAEYTADLRARVRLEMQCEDERRDGDRQRAT